MIDVFEDKINELGGYQSIGTATYLDTNGLFGEPGAQYTEKDFKEYWDEAHDSDPVLMEYDNYEDWYEDTVSNMSEYVDSACGGKKSVEGVYQIDDEGRDEIVNWIEDHEQVAEDAKMYFKVDDLHEVSGDELESWVADHDELLDDYCNYFGLNCEDIVGCGQGGMK